MLQSAPLPSGALLGPDQLSHTPPRLRGALPHMLAHSQRCPSEPCPEQPGPSESYLRAPYPQPHPSNPPMLESVSRTPLRVLNGSSRLHACWVLSSCVIPTSTLSPYPDPAPQGTSYIHLHSHRLGMPQRYPHTPSALFHEAHTPMASLTHTPHTSPQ